MEDVVVAVIEVDYVGARDAALDEGKVIVVDGGLVGVFEQDGGGGAAVVRAYVSGIAQRVVGVVVAEDDDDAVSSAGKFGDDVADGKLPFHGVGGKGVVFDLIAFEEVVFEVIKNVVFEFLVILTSHIAGAKGRDLARVLEGAFGIDVRERGGIWRRGLGRRGRWRAWFGF